MIGRWKSGGNPPPDARRRKMIAQTGEFLTWALENGVDLPMIPRKRVDDGGFTELMKLRGGREMVNRWWLRTLEMIESRERR